MFLISNQKHKTLFIQPLTLPVSNALMDTSFVNCISVPEALPSRGLSWRVLDKAGGWGAGFPSQKAVNGLQQELPGPRLRAQTGPSHSWGHHARGWEVGSSPWRKRSTSTMAVAKAPSPRGRLPGRAQPAPRRSPHLCVCWYSGSMTPGEPACGFLGTRPHSPISGFRLPVSGPALLSRAPATVPVPWGLWGRKRGCVEEKQCAKDGCGSRLGPAGSDRGGSFAEAQLQVWIRYRRGRSRGTDVRASSRSRRRLSLQRSSQRFPAWLLKLWLRFWGFRSSTRMLFLFRPRPPTSLPISFLISVQPTVSG